MNIWVCESTPALPFPVRFGYPCAHSLGQLARSCAQSPRKNNNNHNNTQMRKPRTTKTKGTPKTKAKKQPAVEKPATRKSREKDELRDERSTFANQLDDALHAKDLIRKQLAEMCGINASTVNAWFNPGVGSPGLESVVKVADALDISLEYLAGREPADQSAAAHRSVAREAVRMILKRLQQMDHGKACG